MVYAVIIHSVDSCQTVYFSYFYTSEGNDGQRKTRQLAIMRRILEEHFFQTLSAKDSSAKSGHDSEHSPTIFTDIFEKPIRSDQRNSHRELRTIL